MLRSPSEEKVGLGKRKLREGDFEGALRVFSRLLKLNNTDTKALEGRVVCWEKKGDLANALSDARLMITASPLSAQGYLRCGKVLRLLGRTEDAAAIYQLGINRVSREDRLRDELNRQFDLLKDIGTSAFSMPAELIFKLFELINDSSQFAKASRITLNCYKYYHKLYSPYLTINGRSTTCSLKHLLSSKRHLTIEGSRSLHHLITAIKAGAQFHLLSSLSFIDCDRVDPFDFGRLFGLGLFKAVNSIYIQGETSDVIISGICSKMLHLNTLCLDSVNGNTSSISVLLPNLHSFVCRQSEYGRTIVGSIRRNRFKTFYWDEATEECVQVNGSECTRYYFAQQTCFDRYIERPNNSNWLELNGSSHSLISIQLNRVMCRKLLIRDAFVSLQNIACQTELYLSQCKLQGLSWKNLPNIHTLWLEGCIDGLADEELESISNCLPELKELVICRTLFKGNFLSAALSNLKDRLKVMGLIECSGTFIPDHFPEGECIVLKTRAEFNFIKKSKWDIWSKMSANIVKDTQQEPGNISA